MTVLANLMNVDFVPLENVLLEMFVDPSVTITVNVLEVVQDATVTQHVLLVLDAESFVALTLIATKLLENATSALMVCARIFKL